MRAVRSLHRTATVAGWRAARPQPTRIRLKNCYETSPTLYRTLRLLILFTVFSNYCNNTHRQTIVFLAAFCELLKYDTVELKISLYPTTILHKK